MTNNNNTAIRMQALQNAGVNTSNFFDLNMRVPVGATVQILVDGVPYAINNEQDAVIQQIMNDGYVFNRRTDGRFITAQTFKMLTASSYNRNTRIREYGWDAYLRNCYGYMYQFDMMLDEVHKLARMERENDPEFGRLSRFFTKDVVFETCKHYMRRLRKFVKSQPKRKCKGVPYAKLNMYGNVYIRDLDTKVYTPIADTIVAINTAQNYTQLERALKAFMNVMCKLPYETPKCSQWKDAFKGKGSYVTLLNIVKFHSVKVIDNTGRELDTCGSVAYIESLLDEYEGEYWRFHEMLKAEIARNNFDLVQSIAAQN